MVFWTYMLHCRGGAFYTGHTDDLERRMGEHRSGLVKGFTQDKHPLELVWSQEFSSRYEALAAERQIKGWSRKKKLALIRADWASISILAKGKYGPSTSSGRTEDPEALTPDPFALSLSKGCPPLLVAASIIPILLAEAANAHPREACGLLLGRGERIEAIAPAANIHPDPLTRFEIDPAALFAAHRAARVGGPELLGYYHSHPAGHPLPSATDCEHASGDARVWAIVAAGEVGWFRDAPGGFEALSYRIEHG